MHQVKMLENRLEKAMQKYNAAVARNNDLRQKIDDLRRERLTFDSIYQSLMRDLAEKKRDVAQIMEVLPAACLPPVYSLVECARCIRRCHADTSSSCSA
jgi:chromosome segregation ATPase